MINVGIGVKKKNFMLQDREDIPKVTFRHSAAGNGITPCVIDDMKLEQPKTKLGDTYSKATAIDAVPSATIVLDYLDGELGADMALIDMALHQIYKSKKDLDPYRSIEKGYLHS